MKIIIASLALAFCAAASASKIDGVEVGDVVLVHREPELTVVISRGDCSLLGRLVSDAVLHVIQPGQHMVGCVVIQDGMPLAVFEAKDEKVRVVPLAGVRFEKAVSL